MDHVLTGIGGPLDAEAEPAQPADAYDFGAATGFLIGEAYGIQGGIARGGPHWYLFAHGGNGRSGAEPRHARSPRA